MKRVISLITIFVFAFPFMDHGTTNASWCVYLRDLTRSDVVTARAILSYYRQPWTDWLQEFISKKFSGSELADMKTAYKITSANFIFVDSHFRPKPSMTAIIREFHSDMPNRDQLERLIRELEHEREELFMQFPSGVDPDTVTVCPSQDPERAFYVSGQAIERDKENAVIQWADRQKRVYESLAEKGAALDSLFISSFLSFLKKKTPYPGFSWVYLADNETAMVNFLKRNELDLFPPYKALKEALPKYEKLTNVSQVEVKFSEKLRPGSHGSTVVTVQKRLIQEGYLNGSPTGTLDESTREALVKFQKAHFVTPDGTVGAKTVEKMNISYSQKADWIRISLEGLAEAPIRFYDDVIWINIPTFSLEYYENGKLTSRHKVIVGRADGKEMKIKGKIVRWNNTLPLISEIKSVVINPRWYVPERIRMELEREAANDEFYFQKRGFRTLDSSYSWGEPRLYQLPGGRNPLGKVKFLFDNPYGFYLHDTPEQHLFKRASRTISHGCVRVERALDLARAIIQKDNPKRAEQIENYLKKPDQTYITLERPVPVVITYLPVSIDESGALEFGGDPYGWAETNGFKGFFYVKGDYGI